MRVLVTGGNGFIGRHVLALLRTRLDVVAAGLDKTYRDTVEDHHYAVDILNGKHLAEAINTFQPCAVIHLAAMASVRDGMRNPQWYLKNNVIGTTNVLIASGFMCKRFIFASSGGTVYGQVPENFLPVSVSFPPNPEDVYGISKLTGEHLVRVFSDIFRLKWLNLRLPNVYGPGQDPYGEAGVVAIFAKKMLSGEIPTVNGDGLQTRDFAYVTDVAAAFVSNALDDNLVSGTLNVGTGKETSVMDIVSRLAVLTGFPYGVRHGPKREGEVRRVRLLPDWFCDTSLEVGLGNTVEFFRTGKYGTLD